MELGLETLTGETLNALTVGKAGAGTGTVVGPGIDCGVDCTESYTKLTNVTLTATPAAGSIFSGWSGACAGMIGECTVSMTASQSVQAKFILDSRLINISTRAQVGTGDNVMIGGFVIGGAEPKRVIIRALGPSLSAAGVAGALANPAIQLTQVDGTPVASNDDWKTNGNASEMQAMGRAPVHDAEAALLLTLQPNVPYTPIVSGVGGTTGVALVEVYEVDDPGHNGPRLINISTRAQVGTGDNVLIGGFVIGGAEPKRVIIRALGPSLSAAGVAGALANPAIQLTQVDGTPVASNDDWKTNGNASEMQAMGRAPVHDAEAALLLTLQPNVPYTPIVSGVGGTTGVGLVEIYEVPD